MALGIPQLALHEANDDEECLNVGMLEAAGLGSGSSLSELGPEDIRTFLERLEVKVCPSKDPEHCVKSRNAAQRVEDALIMATEAGKEWRRLVG